MSRGDRMHRTQQRRFGGTEELVQEVGREGHDAEEMQPRVRQPPRSPATAGCSFLVRRECGDQQREQQDRRQVHTQQHQPGAFRAQAQARLRRREQAQQRHAGQECPGCDGAAAMERHGDERREAEISRELRADGPGWAVKVVPNAQPLQHQGVRKQVGCQVAACEDHVPAQQRHTCRPGQHERRQDRQVQRDDSGRALDKEAAAGPDAVPAER